MSIQETGYSGFDGSKDSPKLPSVEAVEGRQDIPDWCKEWVMRQYERVVNKATEEEKKAYIMLELAYTKLGVTRESRKAVIGLYTFRGCHYAADTSTSICGVFFENDGLFVDVLEILGEEHATRDGLQDLVDRTESEFSALAFSKSGLTPNVAHRLLRQVLEDESAWQRKVAKNT